MRLPGKVALVTGSSRGIGSAIAARFAAEGASVIVNASRSSRQADMTLRSLSCGGKGQKHIFIRADIGKPAEIKAMMARIGRTYPRLDILVNNAGITRFVEHEDLTGLTEGLFDEIYRVNLRGPYLCVKEALRLLKKSDAAHVINIASIASRTAVGSNIAYCATKAGLVNMTKSLARALAPDVRVNAVSPGLTETDLIKEWGDYRREQIKKTPLGRLATRDDVADAVFALAASLPYVTGQELAVDGGRTLAS